MAFIHEHADRLGREPIPMIKKAGYPTIYLTHHIRAPTAAYVPPPPI